ncbi:MAG: type II toxin-antitoxin system VapC family toxin [Chloroflexi bacterium]|jgi:hypothetical protein|nr:type II toxin-antitoxin system VapC family toxin [Chloroflexota bacterium]
MATYFLDSSVVIKRYQIEIGSSWVSAIIEAGHSILISPITATEVVAALARQGKASAVAKARAEVAIHHFQHDCDIFYRVIEAKAEIFTNSIALAETGMLRGCDAIQLSAALFVQNLLLPFDDRGLIFVAADDELVSAAIRYGLQTDNPNHYL